MRTDHEIVCIVGADKSAGGYFQAVVVPFRHDRQREFFGRNLKNADIFIAVDLFDRHGSVGIQVGSGSGGLFTFHIFINFLDELLRDLLRCFFGPVGIPEIIGCQSDRAQKHKNS